jgi:putative MFS transporter
VDRAVGTLTTPARSPARRFMLPRYGWRPLIIVASLPALLMLLARRNIPESPRFLLMTGQTEEAK